MAQQAQIAGTNGFVREQEFPIRGMNNAVTADAGQLFSGPRGIGSAFGRVSIAESISCKDVFARRLSDMDMACLAEFVNRFVKPGSNVRGVGGVAKQALSCGNRRVNVLLREHFLVVTGITQVRWIGDQELCVLACMRIVAGGTTHAYGRVYDFFVKKRFIMAIVAQVGLYGGKPFCVLICYFMRYVSRIDSSMACGTAHRYGSMDAFTLGEFLVALKAVYLRR
jgi:hypothetical protein